MAAVGEERNGQVPEAHGAEYTRLGDRLKVEVREREETGMKTGLGWVPAC